MQFKVIPKTSWQSVILPNSGTSFSTISPLTPINGSFFAYSLAGVPSTSSGSSVPLGTMYASRYGSFGSQRIKTYEWLVYDRGSKVLIDDVTQKNKILDHHTGGTPVMFQNAPGDIKDLFKK